MEGLNIKNYEVFIVNLRHQMMFKDKEYVTFF